MAGKVPFAPQLITVGLAASLLAWGPADAAAEPTPSDRPTLTVPLPAGTTLNPGTYAVTIRGNGLRVTTNVTVGQPRPPSPPPVSPNRSGIVTWLLGGVAVTVAVLVLLRLRRRRVAATRSTGERRDGPSPRGRGSGGLAAYHDILELIDAGRYKEALPRLTRLEPTLPDALRTDAGFYIAFSLYQLLYLDEAEHRLAALHREDPAHSEIAYLLAYIRVQRREFDGAEPVLRGLASTGRLTAAGRRLLGVVQYQRALAALRDGNVDGAAKLFEMVQRLGDFRDQVPSDLRNRHVLLGARALLDKDAEAARSHFEQLEDAVDRLPADRRDALLASAKLGLGLAGWLDGDLAGLKEVERLVGEAIRLMDPAAPLTRPWPKADLGPDLAESIDALDRDGPSEERKERDQALRDMHFVRGLAVLRRWTANPVRAEAGDAVAAAMHRFACARALDPTFADVYLVVGLLLFDVGGAKHRERAVALLREARKRGARDPELVQILNRHDPQAHADSAGGAALLDIIDSYLNDATVRASIRADLIRQRARFGRLRDWDDRPHPPAAVAAVPTVDELNDRAELLAARVRLVRTAQESADLSAALGAADELARASERLVAQARVVEQQEAAVLALIGDALLTEHHTKVDDDDG